MALLLTSTPTPAWTVDAFSNPAMTPNHHHHHHHRHNLRHHHNNDAMMSNHRIRCSRSSRVALTLHGISEWREHYSSISTTTTTESTILSSSSTTPSLPQNITTIQSSSSSSYYSSSPLPLLLLPFPPTQILLPGQSTTFQLNHRGYIGCQDGISRLFEYGGGNTCGGTSTTSRSSRRR